jgi:hypothetical protein
MKKMKKMKKVIKLTELDLKRIVKQIINESNEIILSENWRLLAQKALSFVGKNEDDIAVLFKTTEKALLQTMDDLVGTALKSKSISQMDDIQIKLMHFYNPSGLPENISKAQQLMKSFLNGYSKSKGKANWSVFRDEVSGTPKVAQATSQAGAQAVNNMMKGQRVSNRWYAFTDPKYSIHINWSQITNAKNINDYNKLIANAIKSKDFSKISRGGFEKFGVPNFREYLQNNIAKINEVDPATGRWSVIFK